MSHATISPVQRFDRFLRAIAQRHPYSLDKLIHQGAQILH